MNKDRTSYEELVAYAAGELDPARRAEVAAILAEDEAARGVVQRLESLLELMHADDSVAPSRQVVEQAQALFRERRPAVSAETDWLAGLRRLVAALEFDSRSQAALVGVRGTAEIYQLAYESEVADVDLEVHPRAETEPRLVQGQVSVHGKQSVATVAFAAAGSFKPVASVPPDEHGMFKTELEPGKYDVFVSVQDTVVVLTDVEIE